MGVEKTRFHRAADELTLNLDGWEGPLDLLLSLARGQKVDLAPDLDPALVEQYLDLHRKCPRVEARDRGRLSGDGGVARLSQILPAAAQGPGAGPEPGRGCASAAAPTPALDAMREAGARLLGRDRIGRDVFVRGSPEGLRLVRKAAGRSPRSTSSPPMAG